MNKETREQLAKTILSNLSMEIAQIENKEHRERIVLLISEYQKWFSDVLTELTERTKQL